MNIRILLLFLILFPGVAVGSFTNSGSMRVDTELSIGFPSVQNTGEMVAKVGNFAGVQEWYDDGTLSFEKVLIDPEAFFAFDKNRALTVENSQARILVKPEQNSLCTMHFSHSHGASIQAVLSHQDGCVHLGVTDPEVTVTITVPLASTLTINAPSQTITLHPELAGSAAVLYHPDAQSLSDITTREKKQKPSPKKASQKKRLQLERVRRSFHQEKDFEKEASEEKESRGKEKEAS